MKLREFLGERKQVILAKISLHEDEPKKFYLLIQEQDQYGYNKNRTKKANLGVRISGAVIEDHHEVYLSLWSRDESEISHIEEMVKNSEECEQVDKRYLLKNCYITIQIGKRKDFNLTFAPPQTLTKKEYYDQISAFLDWLISLAPE